MAEVVLTDQNFSNEVLHSPVPVLVDFWAPWCGPCKVMNPVIEKLAKSIDANKAKVGNLNVDENQITAGGYGVMSIPTFLFFKNGTVAKQLIGVQTEETLRQALLSLAG